MSDEYQASQREVYWAITWPGLGTFFIRKGKTAGDAYESIQGVVKKPFGECKFLKAL